jgi:hypothetical protein
MSMVSGPPDGATPTETCTSVMVMGLRTYWRICPMKAGTVPEYEKIHSFNRE